MTLGGFTLIRNGCLLDYCWRECIQSMLPICDIVSVSVAQGEDETEQEVRAWVEREPKLRINIYPWSYPSGDINFFVNWIQYARMHTPTDFVIQADADEVLDEASYPEIRRFIQDARRCSLVCNRLNFWKDARHLIPPGECLGNKVVRIAPQDVWLPSDGSHPMGAEAVLMAVPSRVRIFHYGFLRKREAYFEKSRQLHTMFFGGMTDQRMIDAEKTEGNWMEQIQNVPWTQNLIDYDGSHPEVIRPWLSQRGYA